MMGYFSRCLSGRGCLCFVGRGSVVEETQESVAQLELELEWKAEQVGTDR